MLVRNSPPAFEPRTRGEGAGPTLRTGDLHPYSDSSSGTTFNKDTQIQL